MDSALSRAPHPGYGCVPSRKRYVQVRHLSRMALIAVAFIPLTFGPGALATTTGWQAFPVPSSSTLWIDRISALSATDVWAIGNQPHYGGGGTIEHWDGTAWSVVPNPGAPSNTTHLNGIAAISSSDVWAVGHDTNLSPIVEHWDGSSWTVVSTPSPSAGASVGFNAVTATSSSDVWAVGTYSAIANQAPFMTLVEHFDGIRWSIVPSPSPGTQPNDSLNDVSASSASNAWAIGTRANGTLVEHWNGSRWRVSQAVQGSTLNAVQTFSSSDTWAVGGFSKTNANGNTRTYTQIQHFDGQAWTVIPSPNLTYSGKPANNLLSDVSGSSPADIWAVGTYLHAGVTTTSNSLIVHWDGVSWTSVSSPAVTCATFGCPNGLRGVSAVSATSAWAGGWYLASGFNPNTERYTG
jgi:hypothetical protein